MSQIIKKDLDLNDYVWLFGLCGQSHPVGEGFLVVAVFL